MATIVTGGVVVPAPPPGGGGEGGGPAPGAYPATVVYEQLRAPGGGVPPRYAEVRVRAEAPDGGAVYVDASQTTLFAERLIQLFEEAEGNYEVLLDAQWSLSPPGSTYVVTRTVPELGTSSVRIAVPGATPRAWLGDLIVPM